MGLKIWPPEDTTRNSYLKLEHDDNGDIALVAVDKGGNRFGVSTILVITPGGRLKRVSGCEAPGIKTEGPGLIEMT